MELDSHCECEFLLIAASSDLEPLDPEQQQFDLLMYRLLNMLPNGLVCLCYSSDRHTWDEEAEFSSSAFVMPRSGDFMHLPMFNVPGCTRIQTFLSLGILTVLSAFKTPFSWSTDSKFSHNDTGILTILLLTFHALISIHRQAHNQQSPQNHQI